MTTGFGQRKALWIACACDIVQVRLIAKSGTCDGIWMKEFQVDCVPAHNGQTWNQLPRGTLTTQHAELRQATGS